jgi:hypothetical protein
VWSFARSGPLVGAGSARAKRLAARAAAAAEGKEEVAPAAAAAAEAAAGGGTPLVLPTASFSRPVSGAGAVGEGGGADGGGGDSGGPGEAVTAALENTIAGGGILALAAVGAPASAAAAPAVPTGRPFGSAASTAPAFGLAVLGGVAAGGAAGGQQQQQQPGGGGKKRPRGAGDASLPFDPLANHRPWCPFVYQLSQQPRPSGAAALPPPPPGWLACLEGVDLERGGGGEDDDGEEEEQQAQQQEQAERPRGVATAADEGGGGAGDVGARVRGALRALVRSG